MSLAKLFVTAVGLSMDAFAVPVYKDLVIPKMNWEGALLVGPYFGGFQAAMPLFGYFLGFSFGLAMRAYGRWVAFILLSVIGANMVKEPFSKEDECPDADLDIKNMVLLVITTSIDALAIGVTFASLNVDIPPAVFFTRSVTFPLSITSVKAGDAFGCHYKSRAELTGGVILILMGLRILLEHLEILFRWGINKNTEVPSHPLIKTAG